MGFSSLNWTIFSIYEKQNDVVTVLYQIKKHIKTAEISMSFFLTWNWSWMPSVFLDYIISLTKISLLINYFYW